jgi:hypothetical protein
MTELEMLDSDDREIATLGAILLLTKDENVWKEERFRNLKWHFIFEKSGDDYNIYRCTKVDNVGEIVVIEPHAVERWKADRNLANIYTKRIQL